MIKIELGNGKHIDGCLERVLRYRREYPRYEEYDSMDIAQDSKLRDSEIRVANKLRARIGLLELQRFQRNRTRIEAALRSIPVAVALDDSWAIQQSIWKAIENVYRACWDYGVREARTTKVLHKKRPELIPIIDGKMVIGRYYAEYRGPKKLGVPGMVAVTKQIRQDMIENRGSLRRLQKELVEAGINLTRVRLFDMVLWEAYQESK